MNIGELSRKDLKRYAKGLEAENRKYGDRLVQLPREDWGPTAQKMTKPIVEVWRSRKYMVQVYDEGPTLERISVCRCAIDLDAGRWRDGMTWDELQAIKSEIGRGDRDAVEVFPADHDVVNVANFRHLWVFRDRFLDFAWRRPG